MSNVKERLKILSEWPQEDTGLVTKHIFIEAAQRIEELEKELARAKGENMAYQSDIDEMYEWYSSFREDLREKVRALKAEI